MSRNTVTFLVAFVLLFLVSSACAILPAATQPPPDQNILYTQAAQTVIAQLTQSAPGNVTSIAPTSPSVATATPTTTLPAIITSVPAATATPTTAPPTPTPTQVPPTPTPSPTPIPCNWAKFIEDVTVLDGTIFAPNAIFTKTWRLQNIGTCTWTRDYRLVFADGDRLDGPRAVALDENVDPGEMVDVSVELVAPDEQGRYRGDWELETASGNRFGIGSNADRTFYVLIDVIKPIQYAYDFAANYCAARWSSDAGRLECPGRTGDDNGYVQLVDRPVVEIDRQENERVLLTRPLNEDNGYIMGEYPEIEVDKNYRFKAVVGCMDDSERCDVTFRLTARIPSEGLIAQLWETREVYDDAFTRVDVDLSSLEGKRVIFVLSVDANGSPRDDRAFWLVPRIVDTGDID